MPPPRGLALPSRGAGVGVSADHHLEDFPLEPSQEVGNVQAPG